mmetsp:Transcript_64782/g.189547  ORF Transcript_64782/g.189547 Transcript_64782/m.189547 type:complete len:224 (-) Transcript_64782:828-1499(-)
MGTRCSLLAPLLLRLFCAQILGILDPLLLLLCGESLGLLGRLLGRPGRLPGRRPLGLLGLSGNILCAPIHIRLILLFQSLGSTIHATLLVLVPFGQCSIASMPGLFGQSALLGEPLSFEFPMILLHKVRFIDSVVPIRVTTFVQCICVVIVFWISPVVTLPAVFLLVAAALVLIRPLLLLQEGSFVSLRDIIFRAGMLVIVVVVLLEGFPIPALVASLVALVV